MFEVGKKLEREERKKEERKKKRRKMGGSGDTNTSNAYHLFQWNEIE